LRTVRIDDESWDAFDKIAQALGTNRASMIQAYVAGVISGEVAPEGPSGERPFITNYVWDAVRDQIARAVGQQVRRMQNPLPQVLARSEGAGLERPIPQRRPPVQNRGRVQTMKGRGPPSAGKRVTPENCNHDPSKYRTVLGQVYCTCGLEVTERVPWAELAENKGDIAARG
jgi:hypothetical protein